jgi:hypothetical protein
MCDAGDGEVLETFRVRTTPVALDRALARFEASRVVLEVGTHSPWVSRRVTAAGHEAIVANPRRVRWIAENDSKNDRFDAELLARLGRLGPSLLSPIVHRGEQAQRDLILIRARDGLVRARSQLINQVRGFAKSLGSRCPASSAEAFPRRISSASTASTPSPTDRSRHRCSRLRAIPRSRATSETVLPSLTSFTASRLNCGVNVLRTRVVSFFPVEHLIGHEDLFRCPFLRGTSDRAQRLSIDPWYNLALDSALRATRLAGRQLSAHTLGVGAGVSRDASIDTP